jgi:hypothetical protein
MRETKGKKEFHHRDGETGRITAKKIPFFLLPVSRASPSALHLW